MLYDLWDDGLFPKNREKNMLICLLEGKIEEKYGEYICIEIV